MKIKNNDDNNNIYNYDISSHNDDNTKQKDDVDQRFTNDIDDLQVRRPQAGLGCGAACLRGNGVYQRNIAAIQRRIYASDKDKASDFILVYATISRRKSDRPWEADRMLHLEVHIAHLPPY